MVKQTSDGWSDPTEWANRLYDRLEFLGADYMETSWNIADEPDAFAGLNLKQARAAEVVVAVCSALRELPSFRESKGTAVLHDIAGALHDVVFGGSPRLFMPACTGSPGGDGIDRRYLKVFVILAVRFLVEAHKWKETKAVKMVAERFASAGATGRKKKRLSAATIQQWNNEIVRTAENINFQKIYHEVETKLQELRKNPAWPGGESESLIWIDKLANDPLLRSKYG